MKAALSFLALASSALAAHIRPRGGGGGEWGGKEGNWGAVTTSVLTTYTTVCPATSTVIENGKPTYVTYTATSTVTETVPTVIYTTIKLAVTETVHTTYVTTAWAVTDVYETVTCPESVYTTIVEGETVYVTKTNTITKVFTDVYTVHTKIPVTITNKVDTTIGVTEGSGATVTDYSTVVVSVPNTIRSTATPPPTTVILPITSTSTAVAPPATTSGPVTAGANKMGPAAALLMGVVGAAVML